MTHPGRHERKRPPAVSGLSAWQLAWLAAAVFVVSAGYGALMPLMPTWLAPLMGVTSQAEVARHVGLLSGLYAAGVLVGAPLWGLLADRWGPGRILVIGLVGYIASLLPLLRPEWIELAGIYISRGATGFFVAAVVPIVPALVAEHTPAHMRASRFAWLSAMSLLGFLFGPGINAVAEQVIVTLASVEATSLIATNLVVLMSAALGAIMMLGLAATLPNVPSSVTVDNELQRASVDRKRSVALWGLNGVVMFVLAGFELGIVLQAQLHPTLSPREISVMFAECSLVMLGVNAVLFFTGLLERAAGRIVIGAGIAVAIIGLVMLAQHRSNTWMYVGISFTAAGTGLVLPTIAYLAAGASRQRLGTTMGGLAASAGIGQALGSAAAGWLFGAVAQASFAWFALPLLVMLGVLIFRPARRSPDSLPLPSPRVFSDPLPKRKPQEP